jgi:hypothetical protein
VEIGAFSVKAFDSFQKGYTVSKFRVGVREGRGWI